MKPLRDTFAWLTRSFQGQGIGTLMRQAMCAFFFDELDAHAITSGACADNQPSAAVSRKVGNTANGTKLELRDETAEALQVHPHKRPLRQAARARRDIRRCCDAGIRRPPQTRRDRQPRIRVRHKRVTPTTPNEHPVIGMKVSPIGER
jgi:hypothetical protein